MKRAMTVTILGGMLIGSLMLYAAEGQQPQAPSVPEQAVKALPTDQGPDHQQRLERFMDEINKAYEAKDFQRIERLVRRYANARPQERGRQPFSRDQGIRAQGWRGRQQGPWQARPFRGRQEWRDGRGLSPQQPKGRHWQGGRGMGPQGCPCLARPLHGSGRPWAQQPAPYGWRGGFGTRRQNQFAGSPHAFRQFRGAPSRWNTGPGFGPQRRFGRPGQDDFRTDKF